MALFTNDGEAPPCSLVSDIPTVGSDGNRGWREASMTDEDGTPRPDPRQEPNPEPASDASGPKGDGARHPRISRFVGSRPLGKTIDLDIINV